MDIVYAIVCMVFGFAFGSFYNVVGLRVPRHESIVSPPSHCEGCGRRLSALDLVPVLSYLFLGGKCRTCDAKIGFFHPFMELLTGLFFGLAYLHFGPSRELIVALLFISLLVIITVSDIVYMLIPDKVLLPFALILIILRVVSPLEPWWDAFAGAVIGFSILFLIALVSKGGMGGGDIKLFFVIGLVLGIQHTMLALFLSALIGLVAGLIGILWQKKGRKQPIPFGPWIALASLIVYFYGENLLEWYSNLFF
ncbi:prepilin peptidase [Rummeliibacillus stabekisii]|uniref:Prepilin peptidase n=1 Tax=Rummeliibacillus stabekisii TaxID=241244 RepID=A0A143HCM6_9BACL|nr:A24 family peptidase [Rummeliibacillus stabekisii]AMW99498.1 prepilin peptidase [Rummeliibacillus stabekisii]